MYSYFFVPGLLRRLDLGKHGWTKDTKAWEAHLCSHRLFFFFFSFNLNLAGVHTEGGTSCRDRGQRPSGRTSREVETLGLDIMTRYQ